jgi:large subunit ribosomal protein L32
VAVPKRRTSRTKRDSRRANHDKITAPALGRCSNCGEVKLPHRVCAACGFFAGESVLPQPEKAAPKDPG